MAFLAFLMLLLAMAGCSSATYCVCKDGVSDSALQKTLDYACGAGADCSPILQTGACYNPNTVKDHCNYAVNSYFQKKGEAAGSCDFSGTATTTISVPNQSSGCVYPSSASASTTPSTSTTPTGTPSTSTTPTGTTTTTPTGSTTTPTTTTTPSSTPVFNGGSTGLGPTSITDSNDAAMSIQRISSVLVLTTTTCFALLLALCA